MQDFVSTLVNLTYCSTEFAVGMWNELSDEEKENPVKAAEDLAKRRKWNTGSYDRGEVD